MAHAGRSRAPRVSPPSPPFFARWATLGALIALIVVNLAITRDFASWRTLDINLTQVASIVIVGVGMTLVIATGGIDLSVGSLMAIAGALRRSSSSASSCPSFPPRRCARVHRRGPGRGRVRMVQRLADHAVSHVQPIIATLVLFIAGRGFAQVTTNGNLQPFNHSMSFNGSASVGCSASRAGFHHAGDCRAGGLGAEARLFGRQILAIGGNERAARLAGVPVARSSVGSM